MITKADEIARWTLFVRELPADGYLAAILAGSESYIESRIRSDFAQSLAGELHALQQPGRHGDGGLRPVGRLTPPSRKASIHSCPRKTWPRSTARARTCGS